MGFLKQLWHIYSFSNILKIGDILFSFIFIQLSCGQTLSYLRRDFPFWGHSVCAPSSGARWHCSTGFPQDSWTHSWVNRDQEFGKSIVLFSFLSLFVLCFFKQFIFREQQSPPPPSTPTTTGALCADFWFLYCFTVESIRKLRFAFPEVSPVLKAIVVMLQWSWWEALTGITVLSRSIV